MQLRELRAYAKLRAFTIAHEFIDHVSGATSVRPELSQLWQTARARKIDTVLVWKFDRFAHEGAQGLVDRPRSGRPPKVTCALEMHLHRLVEQDPLQHGSLYSQWSCRELATVLAHQTGIQLGRESVRRVLKKP
jgi:transposase